ncbi:MAG: universal stress protein, partial [Thermomicrobiales bacterium]|nr:universal stress protein [Thermomicrobiales bacterium]
ADHLAEAAQRATARSGLKVTTSVLGGSVSDPWAIAESIQASVEATHADLVVMTTRARGLVSRVGLGSVADQLVRRSHVPVLLVGQGEADGNPAVRPLASFLVLLDGSALSEQILDPAFDLAALQGARCTLLRVVATEDDVAAAEAYLAPLAAARRTAGVEVDVEVVVGRNPGDAILSAARRHDSDLIALATRGWGGFKRLVLGSVADTLVQRAQRPILVRCPTPPA